MNLSKLLIINAIATLAAGVVLFVAPNLIPSAVGIHIDRSAYLITYLLGSSEIAFAALCYYGRGLKDSQALRVIVLTCIVFHAISGVAEVYAFVQGVSAAVWWNVALRVVMVVLFLYYGLYRTAAERSVS
jgi:hypothetical protein